MRPELEDFDELSALEATPRSRAMSWLVLFVAIGGFTALAYYAYHSGSQSMRDSTLTVVNADEAPIKSVPADPQGEQFPNKDKTIYDAINPDAADKSAHVEKLLPDAEQPVMPAESMESNDLTPTAEAPPPAKKEPPSATTFVNAAAKNAQTDRGDATPAAPAAATTIPIAPSKPAVVATAPIVVASASPSASDAEEAATPPASASAPAMVNVKPVTATIQPTAEAKDAAANAAAKPVTPVARPPKTGAYKIQLGAFQSEAEAQAQWKKITAKNSDVVGGAPTIVKAVLANGTFYRLRASGFASMEAAKAACATLAARKQACFPAGK